MAYLTLTLAIFAAFTGSAAFFLVIIWKGSTDDKLASMALKMVELQKQLEAEERQPFDPAAKWDEGLNNMMEYTLKGYGLNTDFLKKDGDVDG